MSTFARSDGKYWVLHVERRREKNQIKLNNERIKHIIDIMRVISGDNECSDKL